MKAHYGDPCIHCGTGHDEIKPGPCEGDAPPIIYAYSVIRQAWENPGSGCDTVRVYMSNGDVIDEALHPSTHWPYSERFRAAKVRPRKLT